MWEYHLHDVILLVTDILILVYFVFNAIGLKHLDCLQSRWLERNTLLLSLYPKRYSAAL